jgi:iron complex transport system substrate-binding protein
MRTEKTDSGQVSRREALRYGGAALGVGALAGCLDFGFGSPDPIVETASESERQAAQEAQYGSCLAPTGCVTLDQSPSTWVSYQYGYGDMGVALGQTDGYLATNRPGNYPDFFYEGLPGVSLDAGSLTDINAGDKELFFDLDPDLLLMDPNNAMARFGWSREDIVELEREVAPFFGHFNRRYGYGFQGEYETMSLLETFEAVAHLFGEHDRYEAIARIHEQVQNTLTAELPPASERPSIGLLGGGSDPEDGSFALLSALGEGYGRKQYRDLGVRDVLSDVEMGDSPWYETDAEGLLELDPDVLVVHWTIHQSESTFEEEFRTPLGESAVTSDLTAVEDGRVYRGGTAEQGPLVNLFQTEIAAGQLYPERFGGRNLFSRDELARAVRGERA